MVLVVRQSLLVQTVLGSNLSNLASIAILEFVDVANDPAIVGTDGGKELILEVLVLQERRGLE